MALEVVLPDSYLAIPAADWDALVGAGSPFLEHAYLSALESFGCAVPKNGWLPRPILVRDAGRIVGGAPGWLKTHSRGEFVYDHAWADVAHRAGLSYYPKLVLAVPFTPATGGRLLVHPDAASDEVRRLLVRGVEAAGEGTFGAHVLFDTDEESAWLAHHGAFARLQVQFHWHNDGYATFEDWLATFPSDKRNKIRRERKELRGLTLEVQNPPTPEVLRALHRFHSTTAEQFGPWGAVYLSEDVFLHLGEVWGDRLHAVVARDGDRIVGGAFNVLKGDRLYGRYWGADEAIRFLHFEVCYYRAIEDAIERKLTVFEPGHGGGHKYRRGFAPTITYSNHWLADKRLHEALRKFSGEEAASVRRGVAEALTR